MEITNNSNLPLPFFECVKASISAPNKNEYRVTSLIGPPQIEELKKRHWSKIKQDCSEFFDVILGSALHDYIFRNGRAKSSGGIAEERLYLRVGDKIVTGQPDLIEDDGNIITDYKTLSVWKYINKDFEDWKRQINIYNILRGCKAKTGRIVMFFKDFKVQKRYDPTYPTAKIQVMDFDLEPTKYKVYLANRVALHKSCESLKDNELPKCTLEERWARGGSFAIIKTGATRATKLFDTEKEAVEYLNTKEPEWFIDKTFSIEERKPEYIRCERYCPVAKFCKQYNANG